MLENAKLEIYQPVMLEDLVGEGQVLPSLPEVCLRVREQLEDESTDIDAICATIAQDPAISTCILKLANSNYCELPARINSVKQAVSLLGRERCKHLLINTVLKGVFSAEDNPAFSMQVFWQHSIRTAIIARELAGYIDVVEEPEVMFTAGILHDIGKLLMFDRFPREMLAVEENMIRRRLDELTAELGQVGLTHTAVGEALLRHWGLPELLIDCARCHHEAVHDGPNRYATHLIYLANRLGEYVPPLDEAEAEAILEDIENWNMAPVSVEQVASACQIADDLVFEVMESLGMVAIDD